MPEEEKGCVHGTSLQAVTSLHASLFLSIQHHHYSADLTHRGLRIDILSLAGANTVTFASSLRIFTEERRLTNIPDLGPRCAAHHTTKPNNSSTILDFILHPNYHPPTAAFASAPTSTIPPLRGLKVYRSATTPYPIAELPVDRCPGPFADHFTFAQCFPRKDDMPPKRSTAAPRKRASQSE